MYTSLKNILLLTCLLIGVWEAKAQESDSTFKRNPQSQADSLLNMDANANRPTFQLGNTPVSIGGYFEVNSIYAVEEGDTDGFAFQPRRLSLIVSAPIIKRISFLSEIEFEDGGEEIEIEYAAVDVNLFTELNFKSGIIVNPIGAFNQNHDGPKWEFVERPDVSTKLLPSTFSNAGAGLYGKFHKADWSFGYEAYITNGFNENIINNADSRTSLPATKSNNPGRLGMDNADDDFENHSGKPLFTGKIALKKRKLGEIGFSYMGGVYNKKETDEGIPLWEKDMRVDVAAVDINTEIAATQTKIIGEAAYVWVDIPKNYIPQYGSEQWGAFVDFVQPIYQKPIFNWDQAVVNFAARFDYNDYNIGKFKETGEKIGDKAFAITPALSFRPSPQTVFRFNYRYEWKNDLIYNPWEKTATWYFGLSTYF